jgi:hypothetical protein
MNVRLVAYRKATSAATATTAYNLDLQEAPNVSLNFQFSDVKEPEKRKGSYSQTFKLPFTDNNNQFFQDWYNVNLDTLVFTARKSFDAILYVGTVPQMEGRLQLKSVYQKAQVYEVVLMSNSASLFSTIGEQRLKDVFVRDDGAYSADFNHVYNETNLAASWGNSLQNTAGGSLYDSDAQVSKIVYPMSITREKFYYDPNEARYLNLDQTTANTLVNDAGVEAAYDYSVDINQFRPSIQLKTMVDLIFAKAGFSYTSAFLSSTGVYSSEKYFGKLFMTTGNHLELAALPTKDTNAAPSGLMSVSNDAEWGDLSSEISGIASTVSEVVVPANSTAPLTGDCTTPADPDGAWNTTYNYFTKISPSMEEVEITHRLEAANVVGNYGTFGVELTVRLEEWDTTNNVSTGVVYATTTNIVYPIIQPTGGGGPYEGVATINSQITHTLSLEQMPISSSARIIINSGTLSTFQSPPPSTSYKLGGDDNSCGQYSIIGISWVGYSTDVYSATIDIPACIDPEITQKDFLKDIIERFNLVLLTDPNDDTNLIIEPYNDFIASGKLKYWTDKLDLDKEIVVKDTTEIQKKIIHLSDQEDEDLYNKSFKERYPDVNVYGHLKIQEYNNDFATGELKNNSIFSPFINGQVFANDDEQFGTFLPNMTVQYEFSYEMENDTAINKIKATKPKLFYYCGSVANVLDTTGNQINYYLHRPTTTALTAFSFNTYPVCSPFDIIPGDGSNPANQYTLTQANKSLYWNASPPIVGNLEVFNYTSDVGNWFDNSLYGLYWQQYLSDIYSTEARIMECYLNLSEVDIFDFSFADEIFIKDSYWRILKISNYQVGTKASTKVMLIKSLDTKANCNGCDYVLGTVGGSNLYADTFYLWCSEDNPSCTPITTAPNYNGLYTNPECCLCNGGMVMWSQAAQATNNLYPCLANAGSLPIKFKSIFSSSNILSTGQLKTLINDKIGGRNRPLVRGVDNSKYSKALLPLYGDDIIIKYTSKSRNTPQYKGEAHRIVLTGYTVANTRGYAYPEGDQYGKPLNMPDNINMIIRVKGVATVVGGTSSSYPLGRTEGFAYYTAFKIINGTATQMGTAGGTSEFALKEASAPTSTCTLYIDINNGVLRFGLDDNQTDTKRIWTLTAEVDVNRISNMSLGFDENWALYQNGDKIQLQNGDYLIWN